MAVQLILPYGGGVEEKTNGILVKAENEPGKGIRPRDACSLAEKSISLQLCRRNLAAYGNESGGEERFFCKMRSSFSPGRRGCSHAFGLRAHRVLEPCEAPDEWSTRIARPM